MRLFDKPAQSFLHHQGDECLLLFFVESDASPKPLTMGNPDYDMILLAYYSFVFLALTLLNPLDYCKQQSYILAYVII